MSYRINQTALHRAKALIKSGTYVDKPFAFTADDGNELLGAPRSLNWTEYANWMLGVDVAHSAAVESAAQSVTLSAADQPQKSWWAYPYGKGGSLYLSALREIVLQAVRLGEHDIADAAIELLDLAKTRDENAAGTGDVAAARDVYFHGGSFDIQAIAPGAQLPRFSMVGYTGNPMKLNGKSRPGLNFDFPVVIDLDGLEGTDKSRPILKGHDQEKPLGHTDSIQVLNHQLVAAGTVSNADSPQGQEVISSARNGFPWQASIGADITQNEFVPAGRTAVANNRTYEGPVNIARQSVLGEISFVALGADDDTSASIAASRAAKGTTMKFKAWAKAKGFTDSEMEGEMAKGIKAAYRASADFDKEDKDGEPDGDELKAGRTLDVAASATDTSSQGVADVRAESLRIRKINAICSPAIQAASGDLANKISDIQASAISEGWNDARVATEVELATLRAGRAPVGFQNGASLSIHTGGIGAVVDNDVLASAAALSSGIPERFAMTRRDGSKLTEAQGNAAVSGNLRGMGLQRIMGMVAAAHGISLPAGPMDTNAVNLVLRAERRMDVLGADTGMSNVSLLGITENIANKGMLAGYGETTSVVDDIAFQTDTNDFKSYKRYRMAGNGRMQPVNPAGELESFGLQDDSFSNQVSTVGGIITIRREDIVNDDMGALTEIPKIIGREAAMTREQTVFTTLLSGLATLFPTNGSRNNYMSGTTSALSIAALTAAVKLFMEQVDKNNRPINIVPDRLLIAPALKGIADSIYAKDSGVVVTALGATNSKSIEANKNVHAGLYRPVVSPFMAARGGNGLTGSSDTQFILLPNPSTGMAIVQVGYLRGQRTPIIERGEAPFNTLGIQMRCIYDFGVALLDYRSGVLSAGA